MPALNAKHVLLLIAALSLTVSCCQLPVCTVKPGAKWADVDKCYKENKATLEKHNH